jgi:hypothetical protein
MLWNTGATLVTNIDETPPNFIERKHPRGRKRKQGARTEVQAASKQPNNSGPQGEKGTSKNRTLHQSHEAN